MKAKLTRFELDPGVDNGKVVGSACMMQFDDGVFARLSVEEFSDLDYMRDHRNEIWQSNRGPQDVDATKALDFPAYYDKSREIFQADITPTRSVYINIDQREARSKTTAETQGSGGYASVTRYDYDKVPEAKQKAIALTKIIASVGH